MRKLLSYLIQQRMVDVIVSTGAQIFHDVCEAMGVKHFQGSSLVNDMALKKEGIDRFYNVYVKEQLQRRVDRRIQDFIHTLDKDYQYSSREFFKLLGMHLDKSSQEKDSILIQAARCGVPIYAPALNDSSIGYSFRGGIVLKNHETATKLNLFATEHYTGFDQKYGFRLDYQPVIFQC